jgi:DNA-binding beta-propeller fold protein YncE/cytochrome b involved in lipid metabolism
MEMFSYLTLHTVYLFLFTVGLGLGLGSSVLSFILFIFSAKNGKISSDEARAIFISRFVAWASFLFYGFGGTGLFTLAYESMFASGIFYASMTIAAILVLNEFYFSFRYLPRLRSLAASETLTNVYLIESLSLSVVSWLFLIFHHVIYRNDIGYFAFMSLYSILFFLIFSGIFLIGGKKINSNNRRALKRSIFAASALVLIFSGGWYADLDGILKLKKTADGSEVEVKQQNDSFGDDSVSYTRDDVAIHNSAEDCWLIIDDRVFNATEASILHPAMFACGTDVSVNYHKNHGPGVRDKMMKYYIGGLSQKDGVTKVDVSFKRNESLNPRLELFAKNKSWNPKELVIVVEKDTENILAINGATHEPVARIHGVGFQPHTSVFSSDAKYMYIISRDGWLTKIDLSTLNPVSSLSVGQNSRGTGLTDNDKYVVVGNYEPGNVVIVDASVMKILKTVPLTEKVNGKDVVSRAGAVVEKGNKIVVALKDTNSVWVIDTDKPEFPVTDKFSGIGKNVPALHDAFLTPNGRYYIVASQGSKTAWVLDLVFMKPVAEIKTGETPHTGPGAAWGKYIYIPSLGEGLVTVIDTTTWEPVKYIKTGGPGLFVRSYSKDESYPYIWADTAFGDRKDEIYVIDGRVNEIVKTLVPLKGEESWHPEFTYDGKFVYVVSKSGNQIIVYDAYNFEVVKRIEADTPSAVSNVGLRVEEPGL